MTKKVLFNNKAFTLVEVLVSFAILGLIMVPLSGLFLRAVENNQLAREQLEAGQLAQEVLEGLKSAPTISVTQNYDRMEGPYKISVAVAVVNNDISGSVITPLDISGDETVTIPMATPLEVNYGYNGFTTPSANDQITLRDDSLSYRGDMFPVLAAHDTIKLEMWDAGELQKKIRLNVESAGTRISGSFYTYTPVMDRDGSSSVTLVIEKNSELPLTLQGDNYATGDVALNIVIVRGTRSDGTNYSDDITTLRGGGRGRVNITKSLIASPGGTGGRLYNLKVRVYRATDDGLLAELESYKRME